jgi:hypothetical protein
MSYQFLRVEGYARKGGKGKAGGHSIASVMAEVKRDQDACPHVETPVPPIPIFGDLLHVAQEAEAWAGQAKDTIGRSLRQDGLCLIAGVLSAPPDLKDWSGYKEASTAFLMGFYGDRLKAVVEHTDEKERHLHFYAVPRFGERFEILHPGRAAAQTAKAQGKHKGGQNKEYKSAMRIWQDQFWTEVSSKFGLTRIGPGRRRLTRGEWQAEQAVARLLACEHQKADATAIELETLRTELKLAKEEIKTLQSQRSQGVTKKLPLSESLSTKTLLSDLREKIRETKKGEKKMITKGDIAVIMGDEWAKKNGLHEMKDKLKVGSEPAPQEWIDLAQKKMKEKKKSPSPTPRPGG